MKIWYHNVLGSDRCFAEVVGDCIRIGRRADNDIVLESQYVAEEAVRIIKCDDTWKIQALGENLCLVDEECLRQGAWDVLKSDSEIEIFPYRLTWSPIGSERIPQNCVVDNSTVARPN